MTKVTTTEVHERRHRRIIDRDELLSLVSSTVCNELGLGIKAVVDVVEDLLPSAAPSPAKPGPGGGSKL